MIENPSAPSRLQVLPWDRPLLPQAAAWLAAGWAGEGPLDLSDTIVIVPTRQSGRRLRAALAAHAAATSGQAVFPPRVLLPEQVFDLAVTSTTSIAGRAPALLAWIEVLRGADLAKRRAVFPVDPPQRTFSWALQLAEELTHLQDALAEGGLRFADVPARVGGDFAEAERWRQLAELEGGHDAVLAARGLIAPSAAHVACAAAPAPPPVGVRRAVLLATPDPRPLLLDVLSSWSRACEVCVLVFGAPGDAARFDAWGRPRPEDWAEAPLMLPEFESRVHVCADATSQSEQIARGARASVGRDGVFAVGCADAEVVPRLAAALAAEGLTPYLPQGEVFARHTLVALIESLRTAARDEAWEPVAALARHPAILEWLGRTADVSGFAAEKLPLSIDSHPWLGDAPVGGRFSPARFLAGLDELQNRHLPPTLAEARRHATDTRLVREHPELPAALAAIDRLLGALRRGRFPAAWHEALAEIFGGRMLDTARPADQALAEAAEAWRTWSDAVAEAAPPDLVADEACELALRLVGAARRFDDKPPGAVDIDGWLELVFRDEPHLAVAGCNDGAVPEAVTGHAFLPETLRERLGLKTNAQRLARDAWQLAALAASRGTSGRLDLFLAKTSAAGDPLRPSRLLFLCADEELPQRVAFLFRELPPAGGNVPWQRAWRLRVPKRPPPRALRVTAFRDYLRCPFRFYLKHVLRMEPIAVDKRELDARDFGELVHRVLERLGRDDAWRHCTDEAILAAAFAGELDRCVAARFGTELSLPLIVQVESARQRLIQAARVQAVARAEGWVIQHVEWKFPREQLALNGLAVSGTIDRIERHEATGCWRVLDYKTAESAVAPGEAHLRSLRASEPADVSLAEASVTLGGGGRPRVWSDLQLPLYRWAVCEALGAHDVVLGYFNLPKAVGETAITPWEEYDEDLHRAALGCAQAVAAAAGAGRFWPPAEEVRNDDFAALFHEGVAASVEWGNGR